MRLTRRETRWEVELETNGWAPDGPNTATVWEPLNVDAPPNAHPWTCYGNTIVFYRERWREEIARTTHYNLVGLSPHLLRIDGRWYEVGSGRVVYRDGRWCMAWSCWANSRAARAANTERPDA